MCLVMALLAAASGPLAGTVIDRGRTRQAAGFVATRFHQARIRAIYQTRVVGLVFDQHAGRWLFRLCEDGNGNGLRRAEVADGRDPCPEGPYDLEAMYPGTTIELDPNLPDPSGVSGSSDGLRFGRSDIVSFSPAGTCTSGSLYLRSRDGAQYAVRLHGVLGRSRVLRFDEGTGTWRTT